MNKERSELNKTMQKFTEVIMAFDFKKEYKEFYMPKNKPEIVNVPKANYIAVRGKGNPNEEGGAYQQAISVLYAVAYTLKMSYKTDYKIEGFFENKATAIPLTLDGGLRYPKVKNCYILTSWEHGNQKIDINIYYNIILYSSANIERNY